MRRRQDEPLASVVIPVLNAAGALGVQLKALATQADAPPFEVIVADSGSSDCSREIASSFAEFLNVRVVDASARKGPAHAKNAGAAAATSAVLLFCNADDRVDSAWVAAMYRALSSHRIVTGPVRVVDSLLGCQAELLSRILTRPGPHLGQVPFAQSSNLAVQAGLMQELRGFDGVRPCGQDADLTIRAQGLGYSLGWAEDAIVYARSRSSLSGTARQFFQYGYDDALLCHKLCGEGIPRRSLAQSVRAALVAGAAPCQQRTRRRWWSWIASLSQRAGRVVGFARFHVFGP